MSLRSHSLVVVAVVAFLCAPAPSLSQNGCVAGRVVDAETGEALPGATVRLVGSGASQPGAVADRAGEFMISTVPPGDYDVAVTFLSYGPVNLPITVSAGDTTWIVAQMHRAVFGLGQVVVTASKRAEKATSAPASVTVVDAASIVEQPAVSVIEFVKGTAGLDVVQSGLSQNMVVARGFNNAFSGSLAVLTDNRIASVPSLRFNAYNFIPLVNEDIQQIEIVRGPGSALYGPNAANGVVHFLTRSPFSSVGTWLSVAGGERDLLHAMARHAGTVSDRIGYRISAQYMRANDWTYVDSAEMSARNDFLADPVNAGVDPDTLKIGRRSDAIERLAGELRIDCLPTDDIAVILSIGVNDAIRNLDITGVGGAQARNWFYSYYQLRATWKELFVQAFYNKSDAGDSYLLQSGAPVVDRSSLFVAQVQHSWAPIAPLSLTYGSDLLITTPVTDGTITGRNEDDDRIVEIGAYVQGEVDVVKERLRGVGALRIDRHSRLDDVVVSPRIALVYTPDDEQSIRLTYNSAYSAPTTNDMFLDILVRTTPAVDVRASGLTRNGFTFRLGSDGRPLVRSALAADRSRYMPIEEVRSAEIWEHLVSLVNQILREVGATDTLRGIAPPPSDIPLHVRTLNRETGAFDSSGFPVAVPPISPTINRTIECGYNGVLFDRVSIAVDFYRSHITDFIGTLASVTANVFFDRAVLASHLTSEMIRTGFADSSTAPLYGELLATQIGGRSGDSSATGAPLATISPEQASDPTAVLFAPRNFGSITLYGMDLALGVGLVPGLTLSASLSYVDKNFFHNLDGVGDLSLNAPRFKWGLSADYTSPGGSVVASLGVRHVDGFRVASGVYVGEVRGYTVVDGTVGYHFPGLSRVGITLSAQNLLTFVEGVDESPFTLRHTEFVGTPAVGRLGLLRVTYSFR